MPDISPQTLAGKNIKKRMMANPTKIIVLIWEVS
jgi:hypothetical protein